MQKKPKMYETLINGYSYDSTQRELSNEYQHDRVFKNFKIFYLFVPLTKIASEPKGLNSNCDKKSALLSNGHI